MLKLSCFTNRACAEARSVAKRGLGAGSSLSPGRPAPSATRITHTRDGPPARKAARAVTYATQDESSPVGTSAAVSIAQYSAPPALMVCPFPSGRRRPTLPLSLPLPLRMSHRITHSHSRSRPSCTHRLPGPGRRPLALIWPILTLSVPGLPCPAPRCPTLHRWTR